MRSLALAVCLLVLVPAPTLAGTLSVQGGVLHYLGAPGERSAVSGSYDGTAVRVTDTFTIVTPGLDCTVESNGVPWAVRCVVSELTAYRFDLGDENDQSGGVSGLDGVVIGGSGHDTLEGSGTLDGGDGDDRLTKFGAGSALMSGGPGSDALSVAGGSADVRGGPDEDTFEMFGAGPSATTISLDDVANDTFGNVHSDIENVYGGRGDDTIFGTDAPNLLVGGDGNDTIIGFGGADRLYGSVAYDGGIGDCAGADHIDGGEAADVIVGGGGADDLAGGPGDDRLAPASPDCAAATDDSDRVTGGAGIDTLNYSGADRPFSGTGFSAFFVTLDGTDDDGRVGQHNHIAEIENVITGGGADTVVGDGDANRLETGNGNDTVRGGAGADVLDPSLGNDDVDGGSDGDVLIENLLGGYPFPGAGTGDDRLAGGPGRDRVDYSARTTDLWVTLDGVADDGAQTEHDDVRADIEEVVAGSADDVLIGSASAQALHGGDGDDLLDGGSGADSLSGGPGVDLADYSDHGVAVIADLDGAQGDDGAPGEGDTIASDVEDLRGGPGADRLTGNAGENWLDGGAGADVLLGLAGRDTVSYADRTSAVVADLDGASGDDADGDTLGVDLEVLEGGGGDDELAGNASANALDGGAGDDILDGGGGADVLNGGAGADGVDYSHRTAPLTVTLGATGGETGESDTLTGVEDVYGGSGADTIVGDTQDNYLGGGAGDDRLDGQIGSDVLDGEGGNDTLLGRFDLGLDAIFCGDGADDVIADDFDEFADDCEVINGVRTGPVPPPPAQIPAPPAQNPAPPTIVIPQAPTDRVAPRLSARVGTVRWARARRSGFALTVSCDEACSLVAGVRLAPKQQGSRKLRGAVATASSRLSGRGSTTLTLRFTAAARRRLGAGVTLSVSVTATDATGNARTVTRKVKLRR